MDSLSVSAHQLEPVFSEKCIYTFYLSTGGFRHMVM
jgi:hypothetical protein